MADDSQEVHAGADIKRRKLMVPDAERATHLTRQLRIRLQYAKLKVEHGWQKQTLNEVENLYFRHTQKNRPPPVIHGRRKARVSFHPFSSSCPNGTSSLFPISVHHIDPYPENSNADPLRPPESTAGAGDPHPGASIADASSAIVSTSTATTSSQPALSRTGSSLSNPSDPSSSAPGSQSTSSDVPPPASTSASETPALHFPTHSSLSTPRQPPSQSPFAQRDPLLPTPLSTAPTATIEQVSAALGAPQTSALTYDSFWSTHTSFRPPLANPLNLGASAASRIPFGEGVQAGAASRVSFR